MMQAVVDRSMLNEVGVVYNSPTKYAWTQHMNTTYVTAPLDHILHGANTL